MSSQERAQTHQFEQKKLAVFGRRNGQIHTDCDDKDGRLSLMIACVFGYVDTVREFLDERAQINGMSYRSPAMKKMVAKMHYQRAFSSIVPSEKSAREKMLELVAGRTPLICAAEEGYTEIVRMLLENGEDVNERDTTEKERSPIHWAALEGQAEVVKLLLEKGANVEARDVNMDTPLCLAITTSKSAVVDLLLKHNAKVNVRNSESLTPLAMSAAVKVPEEQGLSAWKIIMRRLIKEGNDLEARVEQRGFTPLMLAASRGRVDAMEQLLEAGANTEARDFDNRTALFQAVFSGNPGMAKLLLDHNARPDHLDNQGGSPLEYAVSLGNNCPCQLQDSAIFDMTGVVDMLLKSKPDLLFVQNRLEITAIGSAIAYGNPEMVEHLLNYPGGNIDQGRMRMPPLCQAALLSNVAIIDVLIQGGVSLKATDGRFGRNALSWAVTGGNNATFTRLLHTPGLGRDDVDRIGRTPLFWAIVGGHTAFFEELRSRGSDVHRPDRFGLTPLFAAVQHGYCGMVLQILKYRPLKHEPKDRFGRSLTWWIRLTGFTRMRDVLSSCGMQLSGDEQAEQGQFQLGEAENRSMQTCDVCTMNLSRDNRGVECGAGCEKYRICHICCAFGASCEDFAK
ncbi:ankyrin repeat domain-containing protein [Aspergillus melleus]|uniref:ankyrin repeat domain-containing protein n=1 Tax=Aspergillus melleus TaxID=138277 RepID=UPI001E8E30EF|nr:uncharacterized protein LDX57_010823 [Aspergillus melleus]KAH8433190.1 hypothetical protein LDX57_010823 [Aspergillus melleus]